MLSSEFDPSQFHPMLSDSQICVNKASQDIPSLRTFSVFLFFY